MQRLRLLYPFPEPLPLPKARGIQVVNTINALAEFDVDIDFAYVPVDSSPDPFMHYGLSKRECVHLLPLSRRLPCPFERLSVRSGALFLWRLDKWLKAANATGNGPHVILVRHLKLAHALLQRFPQLPLAYEAHEIFSEGARSAKAQQLARLEKEVLTRSAEVVVISGALGQLLQERYGITRAMTVIPSATSLPLFPIDKDWTNAHRHVIYSGSLYNWKGAQDLVAAGQWLPGYQITLIGGDPQSIQALREQAPREGAKIEFCGHLSHSEVQRRLASACIAVLPNRAGSVSAFTSPLKLFEYMASGCAIVATDLPVFHEILAKDDAIWAPSADPKALADAIRASAETPGQGERQGARVRQQVEEFTWQGRGKRLLAVLTKVAENSKMGSTTTPPTDSH